MSRAIKRQLIALCAISVGLAALSPQMVSANDGANDGAAGGADASAASDASAVCQEARAMDWFDPAWVCTADGRGLAMALPNQAGELANTLDGAVADFEGYFAPARYNFAVVAAPSLPREASALLKTHGFLTLPWITKSARGGLMRQSVERQVNAQTKGMSEERRAAILAQALAQLGGKEPGDELPPSSVELGALAHEAGHMLFRDFYDGDTLLDKTGPDKIGPDESVKQYGSSSPDWIDEIAAILNENETLTAGRYDSARARIEEGESPNPFALTQFLEMEHPSLRAAQALRARRAAGGNSGSGVTSGSGGASGSGAESVAIMLSGEEAERFLKESGGNPAEFYLQARLFADFLIEVTGDRRIFEHIAMGIKNDGSFVAWLAGNHEALGLGGNIASLEMQFERWIAARFAADASD